MSHIANLMLEATAGIGKSKCYPRILSSPTRETTPQNTSSDSVARQAESHVWRMHHTTEIKSLSHKYSSLKDSQGDSTTGQIQEVVTSTSPSSNTCQSTLPELDTQRPATSLGVAVNMRSKEPILTRRRKISVPELGPMTTVHEDPIDSPTIPGRPPFHERSHSVPVSAHRQRMSDNPSSFLSGPALDEAAEIEEQSTPTTDNYTPSSTVDIKPSYPNSDTSSICATSITSPVTPAHQNNSTQHSNRSPVISHLKSKISSHTCSQYANIPSKSVKSQQETPPSGQKLSAFVPIPSWSSVFSSPFSVSTPTTSFTSEGRSSPKPWGFGRSSPKSWSITNRSSPKVIYSKPDISPTSVISPLSLHQHKSEGSLKSEASQTSSPRTHTRQGSEDSLGLKPDDRGRSKKRTHDKRSSKGDQVQCSSSHSISSSTDSHNTGHSTYSCLMPEQHSFLSLPTGHSPTSATQHYSHVELTHLKSQALSQAYRFEVLSSRDFDSLSREVRALDERCEYLRKNHHSLRAGRQSLHEQICSYLRSSRDSRFSGDALLKQEECLSELDRAIDSCTGKLEQAENRRTRVRQKLLEHFAAAAIMDTKSPNNLDIRSDAHLPSSDCMGENTPPRSPQLRPEPLKEVQTQIESLNNTTKSYTLSCPRSTEVSMDGNIAPGPLNDDEDDGERNCANRNERHYSTQSQHSICIYADNDVYALMDCVEEEIERMGM